jgi:membrane-associated phospholipid phosphatase
VPADQSTQPSGPPMVPGTLRPVGRRRPSGEPPPLPYHLQTSGVGWLLAAVVLVALATVVSGRGLRGPAVAITVADDAVVRWLAGLQAPGLGAVKHALAALSSWLVLNVLLAGLVLALLALRRFRHLIVFLFANVVVLLAANMVGAFARRPRPFGVVIQSSWGGWALPSLQVTFFATALVAMLYTLVPEGRWRNTGKWVAAALVALTALGRVALGADAPTDVLVAAAIGVTIPLLAFRLLTPGEVFPISYRRGRSAHLDIGGARGAAIRHGLKDQLDLAVEDLEPFGLAGSAGSTPLRITVEGDPPTILLPSSMPAATCGPTAGTSWAGSCCMGGWRMSAWGARSRVSCCVLVLVDQSAEDIAAAQLTNARCFYQISTHRRHRRRVGQAAVRAALVVMLEVAS